MGLIKKSTELVFPTTVKVMLYGSAGAGKSTLALSAPKPLLLDFDNGAKRINKSHLDSVDIVQVNSWQEIHSLMNEDLSSYQTIVVDTVGKMMDFIIQHKCGLRQPTIRDWGGINAEFTWFTRALGGLNKNIVFVAHRDTRKEGDDTVYIPALREKSYSAIVTELDLLGYVEMRSENGIQVRTVTFDPTTRNEGKNTCGLPSVMNIPVIVKGGVAFAENDFITKKIIAPYQAMLAQKQEEVKEYTEVVGKIENIVMNITDADSANNAVNELQTLNYVGSAKEKMKALFSAKVSALGLKYDKETKLYA